MGQRQVVKRTHGYDSTILTQDGGQGIADEDYVQQHVVIASILVVVMGIPIAGAYMKFDITDRVGVVLGKMQHGVLHIRPGCTTRMARKEQSAAVTLVQR